jgi:hypothetical protein
MTVAEACSRLKVPCNGHFAFSTDGDAKAMPIVIFSFKRVAISKTRRALRSGQRKFMIAFAADPVHSLPQRSSSRVVVVWFSTRAQRYFSLHHPAVLTIAPDFARGPAPGKS